MTTFRNCKDVLESEDISGNSSRFKKLKAILESFGKLGRQSEDIFGKRGQFWKIQTQFWEN